MRVVIFVSEMNNLSYIHRFLKGSVFVFVFFFKKQSQTGFYILLNVKDNSFINLDFDSSF
jgi:hypothetical protein